jgi:hypothetical protein
VLAVGSVDAAKTPGGSEAPSPGTERTEAVAAELGRPLLRLDAVDVSKSRDAFAQWLAGLPPSLVLNVAGPRESEAPGAYEGGLRLLGLLLGLDDAESKGRGQNVIPR